MLRKTISILILLICIPIAQVSPQMSECSNMLMNIKNVNIAGSPFFISPQENWILEAAGAGKGQYINTGTVKLYLFPFCDTTGKEELITIDPIDSNVGMQITVSNIFGKTWNKDQTAIYFSVAGSNIPNNSPTVMEIYELDVSGIVSTKDPFIANEPILKKISVSNYPNPFSTYTKFNYTIPTDNNVTINIYNSLGNIVNVLEEYNKSMGTHSIDWDGMDYNHMKLPGGEYYYQIISGKRITSRKMIIIK